MPYRLASTDGTLTFDLSAVSVIVGRAPTADLPVVDPTVSRRHAQILSDENGLTVHDLGSSNGTFVNGNKVDTAPIVPGDVIAFGKVNFRLEGEATKVQTAATAITGPTIVRQRAMLDGETPDLGAGEKSRRKLATLLEVSKGLGWAADTDALLVHDAHDPNPSLAFSLAHLSERPNGPTPIGIFRAFERPVYGELMTRELEAAREGVGTDELDSLLRSGDTWTVE